MKLKKLTSIALSGAIALSSTAYLPAHANNVTDEYFNDVKVINKWEKVKSESNASASANVKTDEGTMKYGYTLELKSNSERKNMTGDMTLTLTPTTKDTPPMPTIRMYVDGTKIYLNKEAFNTFATYIGVNKKVNKDYVLIKMNAGDSTLTEEMLKNSMSSTETLDKLINFIKKIDLGVDLNFVKKDGAYTLSWDSNKIVDVFDAYMRYIFSNTDVLFNFYKDVLGIDLEKIYKDAGVNITKAEIEKSSKEALKSWNEQVKPELNKVKQIIKGSKITIKETFKENEYNSDVNMTFVVDVTKGNKLFAQKSDAKSTGNIPAEMGKIEVNFNSKSKSINAPDLAIDIPKSYDTFDLVQYTKEQQAKQLEMLKVKIVANPTKEKITITSMGQTKTVKARMKTVNGVLYVSTKDMNSKDLFGGMVQSKEKYVPFKATLQKQGFKVTWDKKTKTTVAQSTPTISK